MDSDSRREPPFIVDAPGAEEVPVVAWSLLWRERLGRRVRTSERYRWWVLWTVLAGLFATGFTFTILANSLDSIARDLHSDVGTLQWVISGPMLIYAFGMPLLGKAGDIYGHRRVYVLGFAGFTVAAALTALAWSGPSLIAIRLIGSVEGAATGPASMALILTVFDRGDRVKAMGWWSLVGAGAPVIGLVAGGPIVDAFGWRWLFVIQAPIAAIALAVAVLILHETPRQARVPVDVRGALTLATAVASVLFALNRAPTWGWTNPAILVLIVLSPVAIIGFVTMERRMSYPLLPLDLFRRRNFAAPIAALFFVNFAYMGGFILAPQLLRKLFAFSVSRTSLVTLFRPLAFSISAPVAGYVAAQVGERPSAVVGAAMVAASMGVFALAVVQHSLPLVIVALAVSGIGMGVSSPSLTATVANAVDADQLGVASAAQQMLSQVGAVAGINVLFTIYGGHVARGPFVHAYFVGGLLAVAGVAGAALMRSSGGERALRVAADAPAPPPARSDGASREPRRATR
jgi:EmrB/QacA subfamily drug resistance transporter